MKYDISAVINSSPALPPLRSVPFPPACQAVLIIPREIPSARRPSVCERSKTSAQLYGRLHTDNSRTIRYSIRSHKTPEIFMRWSPIWWAERFRNNTSGHYGRKCYCTKTVFCKRGLLIRVYWCQACNNHVLTYLIAMLERKCGYIYTHTHTHNMKLYRKLSLKH